LDPGIIGTHPSHEKYFSIFGPNSDFLVTDTFRQPSFGEFLAIFDLGLAKTTLQVKVGAPWSCGNDRAASNCALKRILLSLRDQNIVKFGQI
jgi:hypothetical protein